MFASCLVLKAACWQATRGLGAKFGAHRQAAPCRCCMMCCLSEAEIAARPLRSSSAGFAFQRRLTAFLSAIAAARRTSCDSPSWLAMLSSAAQ